MPNRCHALIAVISAGWRVAPSCATDSDRSDIVLLGKGAPPVRITRVKAANEWANTITSSALTTTTALRNPDSEWGSHNRRRCANVGQARGINNLYFSGVKFNRSQFELELLTMIISAYQKSDAPVASLFAYHVVNPGLGPAPV